MMESIKEKLDSVMEHSYLNNYGIENYDELRFGKYPGDLAYKSILSNITSKNVLMENTYLV